jgi:hypothetical protein
MQGLIVIDWDKVSIVMATQGASGRVRRGGRESRGDPFYPPYIRIGCQAMLAAAAPQHETCWKT